MLTVSTAFATWSITLKVIIELFTKRHLYLALSRFHTIHIRSHTQAVARDRSCLQRRDNLPQVSKNDFVHLQMPDKRAGIPVFKPSPFYTIMQPLTPVCEIKGLSKRMVNDCC